LKEEKRSRLEKKSINFQERDRKVRTTTKKYRFFRSKRGGERRGGGKNHRAQSDEKEISNLDRGTRGGDFFS